MRTRLLIGLTALLVAACAQRAVPGNRTVGPNEGAPASPMTVRCWSCESVPMSGEMMRAVERRVDELTKRGGNCAAYGQMIANSYRDGLITVKPAMWRVGGRLAAGEARPSGEMA